MIVTCSTIFMSEGTLSMATKVATAFVAEGSLVPALPAREASVGALDGIGIFTSLAAAEPFWRELERDGVLTPYQRYEWVAAWHSNAGTAAGVSPLIAVGFDAAGNPLFLLPLGKWRRGPFTVAGFLGGKHANFNFGPWRRDALLGPVGIAGALARLPALAPEVDLLQLTNQPESWEGLDNPLLALPHQRSPSGGYRLSLSGTRDEVLARTYSSGTRGRLRTKERKLQAIPGYRYQRASRRVEVERYLDAFFAQKAERLAAQGIDNVFAEPGVREFLHAACLSGLETGTPVIELHVLDSDAGMLALFGGACDGRRFSGMINSISGGEHSRHSPGLVLLSHLVANCVERGMAMFDLGVGEADYKAILCDEVEPLFDSFVPLSGRGHLLAAALTAKTIAKGTIKRSPLLWSAAQKIRKIF